MQDEEASWGDESSPERDSVCKGPVVARYTVLWRK